MISESKYIILPYKLDYYENRTSGVLLETLFLNSIPVAPKKLLNYNNLHGIGYDSLEELKYKLENNQIMPVNNDFESKSNFYNKDRFKSEIESYIKSI